MDPFTLASGIAGLVSLTIQVTKITTEFLSSIKEAPHCIRDLRSELTVLTSNLKRLHTFLGSEPAGRAFAYTSVLLLTCDTCRRNLRDLDNKLGNDSENVFRRALDRTRWPLKEKQTKSIVQDLRAYSQTFAFALTVDGCALLSRSAKDVTQMLSETKGIARSNQQILHLLESLLDDTAQISEIREDVSRLNQAAGDQEFCAIVDWLSPLNFAAKQVDILSQRQEGTGDWLLLSTKFNNWLDGPPGTLLCPGIPGAGKSVLASIVVDYLQRKFSADNVAILCIYCSYKERVEQTAESLIASLLKQLVQKQPVISDTNRTFYWDHIINGTRPKFAELSGRLRTEIRAYRKAFIVVDALDECSEDKGTRRDLIKELQSLSQTVSLMITFRPNIAMEGQFQSSSRLDIRADNKDVRTYVRGRVAQEDRLARHVRADSKLEEVMVDKIVGNSRGMFLLARLHMDSLVSKHSRREVRKALENLPQELNSTYEEAMERIRGQAEDDRKLAERVLSWIIYAMRPLSVEELQHAVAIEPGMTELEDEDLTDREFLASVCAGLVVIDDEIGIVRLVHYTTQEYFESVRKVLFPNGPTSITVACIAYLSLDVFRDGYSHSDQELESCLKKNVFLDYAAQHWGHHASGREEAIKDTALNFLLNTSQVSCANQVMHTRKYKYPGYSLEFPRGLSGVHLVAIFGLKRLVSILIVNNIEADSKDQQGRTPLFRAAENGHEAVVKLLLDRDDVEADSKDQQGRTPLSRAAVDGHEAVVKLLLDRDDVEADSKDQQGRTPLSRA
ncbi:MAG: hypothetical protein M1816_002782, partial [Peltula sp. TS41687]